MSDAAPLPSSSPSPVSRPLTVAGRTAPADLWVAVAASALIALLFAWVAQQALRAGVLLIGEQFVGTFGFVIGLLGVLFAGLAFAYAWVGWRLLTGDPVAAAFGPGVRAAVASHPDAGVPVPVDAAAAVARGYVFITALCRHRDYAEDRAGNSSDSC